jgi:single-strand DNA-binding protein
MAGVNKVILIGNLGKDPEVRYLENGKAVANVTLATTEKYKDREGNQVESTEWHDLEMWDGLAKIAEQYLQKGKSIYVEGKIKTDSWQDEQGVKKYRTRIRVQNMTMLGSAPGGGGSSAGYDEPADQQSASTSAPSAPEKKQAPASVPESPGIDDLPF